MKIIRNIVKMVIKSLSKVKTAVVILLIIILSSMAGTVIQQNLDINKYPQLYGKFLGKLILAAKLNDVYHSWWFTLLFFLLILSITLCSYKRVIKNFKDIFFPDLDPKITTFDHELEIKDSVSKSFNNLSGFFKKKHFKINYKKTQDRVIIKLQKNILNAFGTNITHLSIIIILIGSCIGAYFGYKYNLKILKGQTVDVPKTTVKFRLDNFTVEFYNKSNIPKLYRSDISIIDKSSNIVKKSIEVNKPVRIKGIQFSQNSYGTYGQDNAIISIYDNKLKKDLPKYRVKIEDIIRLPNSFKLRVDDYIPDFRIGQDKKIFSISKEPNNPALKITIFKKGITNSFWTFLKFPMMASHKKARFRVKFIKLTPTYYTVLQAVKDPGLEIVLAGFSLLTIGIFSIFFINYYGFIIVLQKYKNSNTIIKIKGICKRKESYMKAKLEKLVKEIKKNKTL